MARQERFELPTPRFVVWWGPLKSLRFVTERCASVTALPEFSSSRSSKCYRKPSLLPCIARLLPVLQVNENGRHIGEADVLEFLGRQRGAAARCAMHIDLLLGIDRLRIAKLLIDAEFQHAAGNVDRAGNVAGLELAFLADVD